MNTSETLNRAADLIEERGWTQGTEGWPDESAAVSLCMEGGIQAALCRPSRNNGFRDCPAYRAVQQYLGLTDPGRIGHTLWWWNDDEDRTASEVIEVLRAAALIESAREEQDAAWETYAELVSA